MDKSISLQMASLPNEIVAYLCGNMFNRDLIQFIRTNKRFNNISQKLLDERNIKDVTEKICSEIQWQNNLYRKAIIVVIDTTNTFEISFKHLDMNNINLELLDLPDLNVSNSYVKMELYDI